MTDTISKVKDRVRKLLNVAADDAATQGEVDNAVRFAQLIMMRNQLDEADIPENESDSPQDETTVDFARKYAQTVGVRLTDWETSLGSFVKDFVGSVGWYYHGNYARLNDHGMVKFRRDGDRERTTRIYYYGPEDDAKLATEIFGDLSLTVAAMARAKYGGAHRGSGREYAEGFVEGIREANRRVRKEIESTSDGRALVVQTSKRNALVRKESQNWLKESEGINLGTGRARNHTNMRDGNARGAGRADGRQTQVSRGARPKITAK